MDLQKRQDLQKAVELAAQNRGVITIECTDKRVITAQSDLVCYVNHVEVTDKDGSILSIPYGEIERVGVAVDGPAADE